MKKRLIKHGIAILGIAVLAFWAITCATGPERPSSLINGIPEVINDAYDEWCKTQNFDKGIASLTYQITNYPRGSAIPSCYNARGVAYYYQGSYDLAIADFEAALRLDSSLSKARRNLERTRQAQAAVLAQNTPSPTQPAPAPTQPVPVQTQAAPPPQPAPEIVPTPVQGNTLAEKFDWLKVFAQSNNSYILEVNANESIGSQTLSYSGKNNITITLRGIGANRTLSNSFTVSSGVTLVLDNNITLRGGRVIINSGGGLIMNDGSAITGTNSSTNSDGAQVNGGGVQVNGGIFTMNGGIISGSSVSRDAYSSGLSGNGGGVCVSSGTFTMNGGIISGNSAYNGGGVYVSGGTFNMSGGTISGNSSRLSNGGGVYVSGGTFSMSGGTISGNSAGSGSGVYVNSGTFSMSGGEISSNTARSNGGGVYGSFTMNNGIISGNTARESGGGVYVTGTFTMRDGTISGNTASENGGGVCVRAGVISNGSFISGGNFTKTGGTIIGYADNEASGNAVKNSSGTVQNYKGHAVWAGSSSTLLKIREGTAGPGDNMSFNGSRSPTASGAWDN